MTINLLNVSIYYVITLTLLIPLNQSNECEASKMERFGLRNEGIITTQCFKLKCSERFYF